MTFEIIVPGRFIEPKDPLGVALEMEGWFTLEALSPFGTVRRSRRFKEERRRGPFRNLVLDQGIDRVFTESQNNTYGHWVVGTGTSTPDVGQVSLQNQVGPSVFFGDFSASAGNVSLGAPTYGASLNMTATSNIGAFGNTNLTEIGIGSNSGSFLFSRALILDSMGEPTAFPIASDEQLRVTYSLILYPPLEDSQHEVDVSGTREVTVRASAVTTMNTTSSGISGIGFGFSVPSNIGVPSWNVGSATTFHTSSALADITTFNIPNAISQANYSVFSEEYVPGSFKRSLRLTYNSSNANSNNLRLHRVNFGLANFQFFYDPPLQKTNLQSMQLNYELSLARRS